jgi:alkylhydroperoxidase/carboxymuconolactone decarboxylase family protein YurZ
MEGGADAIDHRVCPEAPFRQCDTFGAKTFRRVTMSDKVDGKTASPYGYPFWDWMAKEDPEYVRARGPLSALSVGEGKELSIKHREMVIIGILAYRSLQDGVVTHMRRAIQHGATKRELLEAIESAAVPGGGPTLSTGVQALMQLDHEGAFKK